MKLLMASSGFTNTAIVNALVELVGKKKKKINFAIINEAIKGEPGDHRWFAEALTQLSEHFSGGLEFVDLQSQDLSSAMARLELADVIFCFGGNTDYLKNVFDKTGFSKKMRRLLREKVWVGSSAGSCVLAHKESEVYQEEVYGEDRDTEEFLNLVPLEFLPHYGWYENMTRESVIEESKRTELPVYALSDGAALVVQDDEDGNLNYKMVGRSYLIAHQGVVLEENKPSKFKVSIEIHG